MGKKRITMPGAEKIKTYKEAVKVRDFWKAGAPEGVELQIRRTENGFKVVRREGV